jgi:hypothetical protein
VVAVVGNGWRSGEVVAGGLLSFAVDQLRFGTNLFLVATFRHFGPIGRLETDF